MAALLLRKKKMCALVALTVMLDENVDENIGKRCWVRKIFQERKRHGLYQILTNELYLFDKEYFFRFVRMAPRRFEHLLLLTGPHLQRTTVRLRYGEYSNILILAAFSKYFFLWQNIFHR